MLGNAWENIEAGKQKNAWPDGFHLRREGIFLSHEWGMSGPREVF
jgi:hypothetical protein